MIMAGILLRDREREKENFGSSQPLGCGMASRQTGENDVTCLSGAGRIVVIEQTDDVTRGVQTADRVAGSVERLGAFVDLQAAEREGDAAGD